MALVGTRSDGVRSAGEFLIIAAWMGLLFGSLMAVALGGLRRRAGGGTRYVPCAQTVVELPVGRGEALRLGVAVAHATAGRKEPDVDEAAGTVRFTTGPSWNSWGERVALQIDGGGTASEVLIYSRSRVRSTLFDGGRNQTNVDRLVRDLRDRADAARQASAR